jgi:2-keto-4-pentenoate hydratase/2-oxohepta-3-ene-1,7-dioic acid hydratase in catechol pathway
VSTHPGSARITTSGFPLAAGWTGSGLRIHREASRAPRVADGVRLGPPIGRPSKIVCIGLNYRDHAAERGMAIPAEPVIFFKATTSIAGPTDDVLIPKTGSKLDW